MAFPRRDAATRAQTQLPQAGSEKAQKRAELVAAAAQRARLLADAEIMSSNTNELSTSQK